MSVEFDPYQRWLGIRDPERPPNHYRLLGIELFESDPVAIQTAADRQMTYLRTFANGPNGPLSQKLLNEVAAARVCLLDPARRAAYDESLRREQLARSVASGSEVPGPMSILNAPGRGPRAGRMGRWIALGSVAVILVFGLLFTYRSWRDSRPIAERPDTADVVPAADASDPRGRDGHAEDSESSGDSVGDDSDDDPTAEANGSSDAARDHSTGDVPDRRIVAPDDEEARTSEARTSDSPADASAEVVESAEPVESGGSANRRPKLDSSRAGKFPSDRVLGAFLTTLSQRDLAAARSTLQAIERNPNAGVSSAELAEARLVLDVYRQLWEAMRAGQQSATEGRELRLNDETVTVVKRGTTYVRVHFPNGEQTSFMTQPEEIDPRMAIALVEFHYAEALPTAWRLIATFLAIDRDGDVAAADWFAGRAEEHGSDADFLVRTIAKLNGDTPHVDPPAPAPRPAISSTRSASVDDSTATPEPAGNPVATRVNTLEPPPTDVPTALADDARVPDADSQRQAQRTVFAPMLSELKASVPPANWPAEILRRADDPALESSARYVLLKNALQRGISSRDLATSLKAAERMHEHYGIDLTQLRRKTLQSFAARVPAGDRRRFAELTSEFAQDAIRDDDYAAAVQFASLAQSIGSSVPDRSFRAHVTRLRQEYEQLSQAYASLEAVREKVAQGDVEARETWGRFVLLQKGDFSAGLAEFDTPSDAALQELLQRERLRPTVVDEQLKLGQDWFLYGQELPLLEQKTAYRRAEHWLQSGFAAADRSQKLTARQQLDEIQQVLGRDTDSLDLTRLPIVSASVGDGALGVNRNPNLGQPRVQPLPKLAGQQIERYLWACAPSQVEYLVPADAIKFSAVGFLNAPTVDGVQFIVEANDRVIYTSPPTKLRGQPIPIEVNLPKGTHWLKLKVDAGVSPTLDHTYWIAPTLHFEP